MNTDMPDVTDSTQLALAIGEMRGQVREMVHAQNNMAQKVDAISSMVLLSASLPADVTALAIRVSALEKTGNQRDAREGVFSAILRSPTLGWLAGFTATAYAVLTGKVNL